jgi:hypothetical protein
MYDFSFNKIRSSLSDFIIIGSADWPQKLAANRTNKIMSIFSKNNIF